MSASRFSKMVPLLKHLILAHRAQSRGKMRARRLYALSAGLPFPLVRDLTPVTPHLVMTILCCLLTACLFLGGEPLSNTHTDLLPSSMPRGAFPLRRTEGDMSIPPREGGSLCMEPSPLAGVAGCWLSPAGYFQPVLVAAPSSVRYDLPLCSVAELRQKRHCHPQPLETVWGEVL